MGVVIIGRWLQLAAVLFVCGFALGCSDNKISRLVTGAKEEVYTLYSSNWPTETGRSPVATFEHSSIGLNAGMCWETVELYERDSEERRPETGGKQRFWCEQGRYTD